MFSRLRRSDNALFPAPSSQLVVEDLLIRKRRIIAKCG
jgi:hypothetical protein